jgi:hypothetical protein
MTQLLVQHAIAIDIWVACPEYKLPQEDQFVSIAVLKVLVTPFLTFHLQRSSQPIKNIHRYVLLPVLFIPRPRL